MIVVGQVSTTIKILTCLMNNSSSPLLLHSLDISLGFTILGNIFAYMTVFLTCLVSDSSSSSLLRSLAISLVFRLTVFNPTIEVVTFRLRLWCMLGVFLLSVFTRLGHECQDLLSSCDGMHVCTDWTSVYTLFRKFFGGMESVNNSIRFSQDSQLFTFAVI